MAKMKKYFEVDADAFSNGQIVSKLWLCEELERLYDQIDNVFVYGGWYGITAFMLKVRNKIKIKTIRSFDIDPSCQPVADMINENWVYHEWQFKAFTEDCNNVTLGDVDLVINTSTEHFKSMQWFQNIPKGTIVAFQGNNMPHDDHHVKSNSLADFCEQFTLSKEFYRGQKDFKYPDWQFSRYMIIGEK